jgi:glycerol-3-phosphate cytidylyltransferase-like family protein
MISFKQFVAKTQLVEGWQIGADGVIPHIEHVDDPQDHNGHHATEFSLTALHDLHSRIHGHQGNPQLSWSTKVDDKMSTKVAKVNGRHGVGYKGKTAPLAFTPEEVDKHYGDKPYKSVPLKHLLAHAHHIVPAHEDNVMYQVGLLHSGGGNQIKKVENKQVTPNTITYHFDHIDSKAAIGISPVLKTHLHPVTGQPTQSTQQFDPEHLSNNRTVHAFNTKLNFAGAGKHHTAANEEAFQYHVAEAKKAHQQLSTGGHYSTAEQHAPYIKQYHNSLLRQGGVDIPSNPTHHGYVEFLKQAHSKEKSRSKKAVIDTMITTAPRAMASLELVNKLQHHLRGATNALMPAARKASFPGVRQSIEGKPSEHEGLVVSQPNTDGSMNMMKFVDKNEFTRANFARSAAFRKPVAEQAEKHLVIGYGRMNPIHAGHGQLINKTVDTAKVAGADHVVIMSHSHDPKKNPLTPEQKLKHARTMFPGVNFAVTSKQSPSLIHQLRDAHAKGYSKVTIVAGGNVDPSKDKGDDNRLHEYKTLIDKYNHRPDTFSFNQVDYVSAGNRDPNAKGITSASGTKMRKFAAAGDFGQFRTNLPSHVKDAAAKSIYNDVRKGMNVA